MSKKQITICLAFLINGIMAVMTGTLLTYFQQDGLNYTMSGLIPSVQSAGNLIMGLFSGFLIHQIGRKGSSYVYCLCFALGFSCVLFTSNYYILFPMIFISGLGWGLCNNVCHLLAAEKSSSTVLLHCSYAIGAAVAPLIVKASQTMNIPWRMNAWLVIVPSLLLVLLILGQRLDETPDQILRVSNETQKKSGTEKEALDFSFFKEVRFYLCFFLYFFYNGVEACINSWVITYLATTGLMPLDTAQTMLSMIWGMIIIFRLINILLLKVIPRHVLLTAQLIGLLTALGLLTMTGSSTAAVIFVIILGIFMAGISPCIAINSREFINGSGLSSGVLFSGGGLGATILPAVVGVIIDQSNARTGMVFTSICTGLLVVISLVNAGILYKRSKK